MNYETALFEALMPAGLLAAGSVVTVFVDALTNGEGSRNTPPSRVAWLRGGLPAITAGVFIFLALIVAAANLEPSGVVSEVGLLATPLSMLVVDHAANFATVVLCMAALVVLSFAVRGPNGRGAQQGAFYSLLMLSLTGCVTTVSAGNYVSLFFALELATLPAIALISLERDRERSIEAGTRLLLVLGFASAVALYGVALLHGARGDLAIIDPVVNEAIGPGGMKLAAIGVALIWIGMLTRLGIAPFHYWLPNVCDGAPPIAASWASTGVVGAVAFALLRLGPGIDSTVLPGIDTVLSGFAMLSMAVGSVFALLQSSVKRVIAYGAVAHAGFLLAVLSTEAQGSAPAAALEITTFTLMQLGAFGVVSVLSGNRTGGVQLGEFAGLAERAPILAASFSLFLLGLAGLPGTAGFISRLQVMQVTIASENIALTIATGAATVVLFAAYSRVAIAMYMLRSPGGTSRATPLPAAIALLFCAAATLGFGVQPAGGLFDLDLLELVRRTTSP